MLRLTHSQCSSLIDNLKQYDFSGFGGEASASSSITIDRRTGVSTTVTLASMLDNAMEEMFSQYVEGGRYLELEGKWLAIAYKDLAAKYQRFHVSSVITTKKGEDRLIQTLLDVLKESQIKAKPGNLLDRVVDKLSTTGGSTVAPLAPSATTSATSAAAAWLHRYGGNAFTGVTGPKESIASRTATPSQSGAATPSLTRTTGNNPGGATGSDSLNQDDGKIRLEIVENFLRIHAEAVGRVVELSGNSET